MTPIRHLHITAFKRFAHLDLPLGDLTVLAGTNGAGKTSVLHALLLARLAAHSEKVHLNGPPFDWALGEALDVAHKGRESSDLIQIGVTMEDGSHVTSSFQVPDERSTELSVVRVAKRVGEGNPARTGLFAVHPRGFSYLAAERIGPRDVLPTSPEGGDKVGPHGESVASVLAKHSSTEILEQMVHPETFVAGAGTRLPEQTELWLSSIVRPVLVQATWIPGTSSTTVRFRDPDFHSDWTRPANTGFGLTVALPVVTAGLLLFKGGLLVVESPEAHLHPRGQSAIGAFLARLAGSGVQVVIETHSDHVLNGIRRAVAIDRTLKPEATKIAFFVSRDQTAEVELIEVDERGALSAWPEFFFDQTERDLATLAAARRNSS